MTPIIAREGYPLIVIALLISVGCYALSSVNWHTALRIAAVLFFLFALFTAYFFRDPERSAPYDSHALIAPADGTVIDIRTVEEPLYLKTAVVRISIFMSVFDVHVNRSPVSGTIDFIHYHPGKFISAFKEKASLDNESILVGIVQKDSSRKIAVKLIAGLIARRIVFKKQLHDELNQGERVGMIRFGSRAEVYCPASTELTIKQGDKVKAGLTLLGILKD
jgi:phosphatidylserine decarboxylase